MIPASAYTNGPDSYSFGPGAMLGSAAYIGENPEDLESCIIGAAAAPLVKPGRALFFTNPYTELNMKSVAPVAICREAHAAALATEFAGVLAPDIWQTRSNEPVSHVAAAPADDVKIDPNSFQPRAVARQRWVEVSSLTGIGVNTPVTVNVTPGPTLGTFAASGGLALPASMAVFSGQTATVRGTLRAVIRFPVRVSS